MLPGVQLLAGSPAAAAGVGPPEGVPGLGDAVAGAAEVDGPALGAAEGVVGFGAAAEGTGNGCDAADLALAALAPCPPRRTSTRSSTTSTPRTASTEMRRRQ